MIAPKNVQIGQRALGNTGLTVSEVSFGTVELGLDYGIPAPGDFGRPTAREAMRMLHEAADLGINLFDTAPTYGESEGLLGQALGGRVDCLFATKVAIPSCNNGDPLTGSALHQSVKDSLIHSLRSLHRDVLDIVQIHNATVEVFESEEWRQVVMSTRGEGSVRVWGASVYTEEEALAAIHSGICQIIQVPYNLLDQQMATRVLPLAAQAGVGVMVRSAFLKGVLTEKGQWLPGSLECLRHAARRIQEHLSGSWKGLSQMALRFCLSTPGVSSVLVGLRTDKELQETFESVESGQLSVQEFQRAQTWSLHDEPLLNPSCWPAQ